MVETIFLTLWECPYCKERYEDEDEAEDCAKECVDIESPNKIELDEHFCDYCDGGYKLHKKAEGCEQKHLEKNDKYVEIYNDRVSKLKLKKASEHPTQKKLK